LNHNDKDTIFKLHKKSLDNLPTIKAFVFFYYDYFWNFDAVLKTADSMTDSSTMVLKLGKLIT